MVRVSDTLHWMINARNVGKGVINEFLGAAIIPSAVLSRLALSIKLTEALERSNIEALRMRLVRIDEEGKIYKVYDDVPIEARRKPYLKGALSEELSRHVSPGSPLMQCATRSR